MAGKKCQPPVGAWPGLKTGILDSFFHRVPCGLSSFKACGWVLKASIQKKKKEKKTGYPFTVQPHEL